jgi:hypothetical protein
MDFLNIEYLKSGNFRQKEIYDLLTKNNVLTTLQDFEPILVGTFPIGIDIDSSDLDIICCFKNSADFTKFLLFHFSKYSEFKLEEKYINGNFSIIANFRLGEYPVEIFGQQIPTIQQMGYRHMITEYKLLQKHGEDFRQKIIHLKKQGLKTEPAFAKALGISGNPYTALLNLE